jgi:hypothetical protein
VDGAECILEIKSSSLSFPSLGGALPRARPAARICKKAIMKIKLNAFRPIGSQQRSSSAAQFGPRQASSSLDRQRSA